MKNQIRLAIFAVLGSILFFIIKFLNDSLSNNIPLSRIQSETGSNTNVTTFAQLSVANERISLPMLIIPALNVDLVPIPLYPVLGIQSRESYVSRRRLLESLGDALSANEIRALYMFLHAAPEQVGLSRSDYNGVGDVLLLKIEDQKILPEDYSDHLVFMFLDETRDKTWRDYCLQHLGTVYRRMPEEKRPIIKQTYLDALEPGSIYAGTALISMRRSAGEPDLPPAFIVEKAFEVASSGSYDDAERLTGLHVAAEFNHPEAVKLAREIVSSQHSASFRSAALAVIGSHGEQSDLALLERYVKSSDIRIRTAANAAMQKLLAENNKDL